MLFKNVSVVIPAKNESQSIGRVLRGVKELLPNAELVVVDDGSNDETAVLAEAEGARVVKHMYSKGNGAAIKSGARAAQGEVLVFMDADGQHDPNDIPRLLMAIDSGFDMVVGARQGGSQASVGRGIANAIYCRLASFMTGHKIEDLTSGFRAVRADKFRKYLHMLPNGFSYPTTITMAFFRSGLNVGYLPIHAAKREGASHIKLLKDGFRFLLIIIKIGTLYSPLKIFIPVSFGCFSLGLLRYAVTWIETGRFTNMSAFLFISSVIIFLMGLVSEQATQILYSKHDEDERV